MKFYKEAFTASPPLAENGKTEFRRQAATAAILAASTSKTPEDAAIFRKEALEWLRADLVWWSEEVAAKRATHVAAQTQLRSWQTDPELNTVRTLDAIEKLAKVERLRWEAFWKDVATWIAVNEKDAQETERSRVPLAPYPHAKVKAK